MMMIDLGKDVLNTDDGDGCREAGDEGVSTDASRASLLLAIYSVFRKLASYQNYHVQA